MERRISYRAQVDVPIYAFIDGFRHECRAVDLSSAGMVFERSRGLLARDLPGLSPFEIHLPEARPVRARGRCVWGRDRLQAIRFVLIEDADRLTIAEHLDRRMRLREPLH